MTAIPPESTSGPRRGLCFTRATAAIRGKRWRRISRRFIPLRPPFSRQTAKTHVIGEAAHSGCAASFPTLRSNKETSAAMIQVDLKRSYPRKFVPADADMGNWAHVEPLFAELLERKPDSPEELEKWLFEYSELSAALSEEEAKRYI